MDKVGGEVKNWKYVSYEKIPESFNQWKLTESDYRVFKKTDWVVTEKIHGANFGITTDGFSVGFAKRKEFLPPEADFFNYQSLKDKLVEKVKEIFRILQAERKQLAIAYVYGELFGGEYPHPDVAAVTNIQAVQTGVYYSPKIEYCAFDIAIEENNQSVAQSYLDYDKAIKLFQQVGIMYSQPLFIGRYEEALAYNVEFDSTIPALLGLPKLPFINKAEGIVIKPVKSIYIDTPKAKLRPILKKKIPEFAEDSRFHQAKKWETTPAILLPEDQTIESELSQEMLALVTPNRLNNVISKIGRVSASDQEQKQEVIELLVSDVLETFNEEYESLFCCLSGEIQQNMIEQMHYYCDKLVDDDLR
ncbi:RNA ligase family protein [Iningainema tapete]|uniref:RNA ligase n=1 Tax=Iningainema tapete BLCC-T55 TaxID=2748662 RepID=A0A8J6XG82_9CYAN|nr:RNA ligase family protein [Iningainema tapete]MBD2771109.1 RNA ligase [Iningainema tapete BLCC-T55]